MSDVCRSCQAPVWQLRHERTGNFAPIEQATDPTGNVLVDLEAGTYTVVGQVADRVAALDRGLQLHRNHFARCPHARAWTRRARR
jgi:hypothetical protein